MKKKMKPIWGLVIFSLPLLWSFSSENYLPPPVQNTWTTYDVLEESWFEFAEGTDLETLSPFDVITARHRAVNKRKEIIAGPNGEPLANTIFYDPGEAFEPWMPQIKRIELSGAGIKFFDDQDVLIRETELSPKQDSAMEVIAAFSMEQGLQNNTQMEPLGTSAINDLQSAGFSVQELQTNVWMISNPDTRIIYDSDAKWVKNERLENGVILQSLERSYTRDASGNYMASQTIYKNYTTLGSGACGAFVSKRTISNYSKGSGPLPLLSKERDKALGQSSAADLNTGKEEEQQEVLHVLKANSLEDIRLYPNPGTHEVHVVFPALSTSNTFHLIMVDAAGTVVRQLDDQPGGSSRTINIEALPKGIYFLKISNAQQTITKKFVKQ